MRDREDLVSEARRDTDPRRVEATPEKRFFISMLVRDIELIPAILDLVDNSIDGARRMRRKRARDRFRGLYVRLVLAPDGFGIVDNCGGIAASHARDYAFRFGRSSGAPGNKEEVGQFGVGMKRALFKLGNAFRIESTSAQSHFVLPVNVAEWERDRSADWTFRFSEVDESATHDTDDLGTRIDVTDLHQTVADDFGNPTFVARLRNALELRHQEALQQGIELTLQDARLRAITPTLRASDDFQPIHIERNYGTGINRVHLALYAGIDGTQDVESVGDSETEAETIRQPSRAGWYFFCNDRLLLAADQTPLTGWGSAGASYHPQYRMFRGYVYLTAAKSSLLPWNTTKTGVDEDSPLFRNVQGEMFSALRMVQAVLNRAKDERQDNDEADRPVLAAIARAPSRPVRDVPESEVFVVPAAPKKPTKRQRGKRIAYNVDPNDFNAAAAELDVESAADVGRLTFEYFLDKEIGET